MFLLSCFFFLHYYVFKKFNFDKIVVRIRMISKSILTIQIHKKNKINSNRKPVKPYNKNSHSHIGTIHCLE